jgi:hypothetical protein
MEVSASEFRFDIRKRNLPVGNVFVHGAEGAPVT